MTIKRSKSKRRGEVSINMEGDTSNLPWDLMCQILTKLPVKSLMRFKVVCKPWRDLISEPKFINTHLREAIKADRKRVICSNGNFFVIDCESGSIEQNKFPIKKYQTAEMLCSCNGLVLLGDTSSKTAQSFVLWNPSIREYKRFSYPYPIHNFSLCGLSSDSSDDYKLVLISKNSDNYDDLEHYYVVFQFKTNSWTEQKKFPYKIPAIYDSRQVMCIRGSPHWTMCILRRERKVVVYFDGTSEKFKEFELPVGVDEVDGAPMNLVNLRGNVGCVKFDWEIGGEYEVWLMKEYGQSESWTKMHYTIPSPQHLDPWRIPASPWHIGLNENGEMVFHFDNILFAYNPTSKKMRTVTTRHGFVHRRATFLETLVVPTLGVKKKKSVQNLS